MPCSSGDQARVARCERLQEVLALQCIELRPVDLVAELATQFCRKRMRLFSNAAAQWRDAARRRPALQHRFMHHRLRVSSLCATWQDQLAAVHVARLGTCIASEIEAIVKSSCTRVTFTAVSKP